MKCQASAFLSSIILFFQACIYTKSFDRLEGVVVKLKSLFHQLLGLEVFLAHCLLDLNHYITVVGRTNFLK